jgi:hypothetical protein
MISSILISVSLGTIVWMGVIEMTNVTNYDTHELETMDKALPMVSPNANPWL